MGFKVRTFRLPKARTEEDLLVIHGSPLKRFSWRELKLATHKFSKSNLVGRGGFGSVYSGQLEDGSLVAIKRCHKKRGASQDLQFRTELEIGASQASDHPNVLRLRGYCMTRSEQLLVYPFMPNGSLASRLWERPRLEPPLDWAARKKIALGVAKGLAYFQGGSSFTVIHCDIKAGNILLDAEFNACLADFGLARFVRQNGDESNLGWLHRQIEEEEEDDEDEEDSSSDDDDKSNFTSSCWNFTKTLMVKSEDHEGRTKRSSGLFSRNGEGSGRGTIVHENGDEPARARPMMQRWGTLGYLAPEHYAIDTDTSTNTSSLKTDVYAYGVMLLEIISGRRAYDPSRRNNNDNVMLLDWAKQLVGRNESHLVVDPDLKGSHGFIEEEMEQLLQLALLCTSRAPSDRPVMLKVINTIEDIGNRPKQRGIFIWDNAKEPAMQDRWKVFLYEVVSDALPTKSKLCRSGMSLDPLCPLCNEFEEDNLHLFFKCDFSNRVWESAVGIRIDILGFGSVKEAVDAILTPKAAKISITWNGEAGLFAHKGVAIMYSIWTHRNEVCFDKVSPNVVEVVSLSREYFPDQMV